jgi:hypothetical protein
MAKRAKRGVPKERSAIRWGMQVHRSKTFRHRADRRPKDARRAREEAGS